MRTMRELIEADTEIAETIWHAQKQVGEAQAVVRDLEDDRRNLRRKMLEIVPHLGGPGRLLVKMDDGKIAVVTSNASASSNQGYAVEIEISEVV